MQSDPADPPRTLELAIYGLVVGSLGTGTWWLLTSFLSHLPPWWSLGFRAVVVVGAVVVAGVAADPVLARVRTDWRRIWGNGGHDAA